MTQQPSRIVQENVDALIERERAGRIEHGDDMDRTDFPVEAWLAELISESLDSANYGRKLMHMLPKLLAAADLAGKIGYTWTDGSWQALKPSLPSEEVNALPEHVRKYIMWLETNADPGHTLQDNFRLTEENAGLRAVIAERAAAVTTATNLPIGTKLYIALRDLHVYHRTFLGTENWTTLDDAAREQAEAALAEYDAAQAEVERAQVNMDAGWYARREEHARVLGFAGVADALEALERLLAASTLAAPEIARMEIEGALRELDNVTAVTDQDSGCIGGAEHALRRALEAIDSPAAPGIGHGNLISSIQSMRGRMMAVLVPKFGEAFDGDFDAMLEAINALKRIDASLNGGSNAMSRAYGYLWHVNHPEDIPAGHPFMSAGRAAVEARKELRALLTHEQRGEGINWVRQKLLAVMQATSAEAQASDAEGPATHYHCAEGIYGTLSRLRRYAKQGDNKNTLQGQTMEEAAAFIEHALAARPQG